MFPGDPDLCRWSTNGIDPAYDTIWTEETTGNQQQRPHPGLYCPNKTRLFLSPKRMAILL